MAQGRAAGPTVPRAPSAVQGFCDPYFLILVDRKIGEGTFFRRLRHSMRLFHLHSTVKIRPFPPVFLLAESGSQGIFPVIPLELQRKSSSQFLWHSLPESPNPVIDAVNPGGPSTARPFRDIRLSNETRIYPYEI